MPKTNRDPLFPYMPGFAPTWEGNFPALNNTERHLMIGYLNTTPDSADEIWYNVAMDGLPDDDVANQVAQITENPNMVRAWWRLNAKRCDAIVRQANAYRVIELRARAGPQTLGELILYDKMSRSEWPHLEWAPLMLICYQIDPIIKRHLATAGFELLMLPLPAAGPHPPTDHFDRPDTV